MRITWFSDRGGGRSRDQRHRHTGREMPKSSVSMSSMGSIAVSSPARLTIEGTLILLFSHVVVDFDSGSIHYCLSQ